MFEHVSASEFAKWMALVFAAAFIGFFGKSLGMALLSLFQKKNGPVPEATKPPERISSTKEELSSGTGQVFDSGDISSKDGQKLIKKAMKAQEKASKKLVK
ncbi:MAG: hypothetical protein ABSA71_10680 [Desulfomonilia bacterium]|jgi:hypothetical protein